MWEAIGMALLVSFLVVFCPGFVYLLVQNHRQWKEIEALMESNRQSHPIRCTTPRMRYILPEEVTPGKVWGPGELDAAEIRYWEKRPAGTEGGAT